MSNLDVIKVIQLKLDQLNVDSFIIGLMIIKIRDVQV